MLNLTCSPGAFLEVLIQDVQQSYGKDIHLERRKKYRDNDKVIGEIDLLCTISIGLTIELIGFECRDRKKPGDSPWIWSIFGKKTYLKLHDIVAVSTSGFTSTAVQAANKLGVKLFSLKSGPINIHPKKIKIQGKDAELYELFDISTKSSKCTIGFTSIKEDGKDLLVIIVLKPSPDDPHKSNATIYWHNKDLTPHFLKPGTVVKLFGVK